MSMAAAPEPAKGGDPTKRRAQTQGGTGIAPMTLAVLGSAFALELLVWARTMAGAVPNLTAVGASDGVFLIIAILIAGVARTIGSLVWGEGYLATLAALAPVVPMLGGVLIVILYLTAGSGQRANPIYLGAAAALGIWVFVAPVMRWIAEADKAQPRSYGELVIRTRGLATKLHEIQALPPQESSETEARLKLAWSYVRYLEAELGDPDENRPASAGFRYANAVGYMNLWRALHRAEELLILIQPKQEAFAASLNDSLRLSSMPSATIYSAKIRKALAVFGKEAAPAICDDTVKLAEPPEPPDTQATAIAVLSEVRHAFNIYKDDTWERLIRQRNRLLRTVLITSTVALLMLTIAVLFGVSKSALSAAVAIALVGAIVGLFARLGAEAKAGPALDDFGLFEARLLATPILSGLAAIGGVLVLTFGASFLTTGTASAETQTTLEKAFSLSDNPRALVTAALFGLTPELLTGWLSKQSETIRTELAGTSTEPAGKQS